MLEWSFLCADITQDDFLIDCRAKSEYEKSSLKKAHHFPFIKKAVFSDDDSNKKMLSYLDSILLLFEKSKKDRIVVFDEGMGMYAARMLYLLRSIGIEKSYIYSQKWSSDIDYPKEQGKLIFEFEVKETNLTLKGCIDKKLILDNLTKMQIFDSRTLEEYQGKLPKLINPEKGQVCGRLPGALLWDWRKLYQKGGLIDRLAFREKLSTFPFIPERTTVIYDYNGARSSLLALMLQDIGFLNVLVYQGSWFEWRHYNLPKQSYAIYGNQLVKTLPRVGGHKKI